MALKDVRQQGEKVAALMDSLQPSDVAASHNEPIYGIRCENP